MKIDIYNTSKKYNILYADPPWRFEVWNRKNGLDRSADKHYKTMTKEDIQRLPIKKKKLNLKILSRFLLHLQ